MAERTPRKRTAKKATRKAVKKIPRTGSQKITVTRSRPAVQSGVSSTDVGLSPKIELDDHGLNQSIDIVDENYDIQGNSVEEYGPDLHPSISTENEQPIPPYEIVDEEDVETYDIEEGNELEQWEETQVHDIDDTERVEIVDDFDNPDEDYDEEYVEMEEYDQSSELPEYPMIDEVETAEGHNNRRKGFGFPNFFGGGNGSIGSDGSGGSGSGGGVVLPILYVLLIACIVLLGVVIFSDMDSGPQIINPESGSINIIIATEGGWDEVESIDAMGYGKDGKYGRHGEHGNKKWKYKDGKKKDREHDREQWNEDPVVTKDVASSSTSPRIYVVSNKDNSKYTSEPQNVPVVNLNEQTAYNYDGGYSSGTLPVGRHEHIQRQQSNSYYSSQPYYSYSSFHRPLNFGYHGYYSYLGRPYSMYRPALLYV